MTLKTILTKRLEQLEHRKMMIPRYVENNKAWSGKNHYSLDMLPPLQLEIEETKAAINGIGEWEASGRQKKKEKA